MGEPGVRMMRSELMHELIADEGTGPMRNGRFMPYRCPAGRLTIGYGRNLQDRGISQQEAERMLANDVAAVEMALADALPWFSALDPVRQDVLINMGFNLGVRGLLGFQNTLSLIGEGRYTVAADEMLRSRWARQVGKRAKRLAEQMRTGKR